jgi:hypothetical protein
MMLKVRRRAGNRRPRHEFKLKFGRETSEDLGVEVSTATQEPAPRQLNGGFPEPYMRLTVQLVRSNHRDCGRTTMIRVPAALPHEAIRRVVCGGCQKAYQPTRVQSLGVLDAGVRRKTGDGGAYNLEPLRKQSSGALVSRIESAHLNDPTLPRTHDQKKKRRRPRVKVPSLSMPSVPKPSFSKPSISVPKLSLPSAPKLNRPSLPKPAFATSVSLPKLSRPKLSKPKLPRLGRGESTLPAYVSIPVAFAAVVVGIVAIQGWNASTHVSQPTLAQTPTSASPASASPAGGAAVTGNAKLVRGSNFSIALPAGWKETAPPNGATFGASAEDGSANATLWIQNDPSLDYPTFEARSLAQLRQLAGSAHVASRVVAPTADGTVVHLAADAPAGKPAYNATLRVTGPYRYYLATTVEPDASTTGTKGAELLANSLTPINDGASK